MKVLRFCSVGFVLLSLTLCTACNTDAFWGDGQKAQGPTTDPVSPEGMTLPDIQIADATEVDLVEELLTHRAMYHRTLRALQAYYADHGYEQKRRWAVAELAQLQKVQPFKYVLSAEIPAQQLRPTDSIAEADRMYEEGLELMRQGGHGTPALYRGDKMLQAVQTFTKLITKYPSSDKIDDSAFWCGEIHKEYFKDQEPIAVKWYERAFTWNPETPHPARVQAAVVYDFRMHDRAKALELYRQVLESETDNKSNVSFAVTRIDQLTDGGPMVTLDTPPPDGSGEVVATPTASDTPAPPES